MSELQNVPVQREDFIDIELLRLVDSIPKTDPCSSEYGRLLENIERFACAATDFSDIWDRFHSYYTRHGENFIDEAEIVKPEFKVLSVEEIEGEPEEKVEEQTEAPKEEESQTVEDPVEEETYDAATVKSAIAKARSDGKLVKISDWLKENWGVTGFPALPAKKYPEVMKKLKELEVI